MTQLTKDDVSWEYDEDIPVRRVIDFSKFQEVVEFYDEYKYHEAMLRDQQKEAWNCWLKSFEFKIYKAEIKNENHVVAEEWFIDWLFNYCFKDGLQ